MSFSPLAPLVPYIILSILLLSLVTYFFVKELRSPGHDDATVLDWTRRLGVTILVIFIGFGPGTMVESNETARANVDVFFVVDRTGSMAAEDYGDKEPRLVGVRQDIMDIVKMLPGSRFGVVSFDSSAARQLPLTTDTNALRIWSQNLTQEVTIYSQGSSVNRVHKELFNTLQESAEKDPQNQRVVIFMTDAENTTEDDVRESFADLAQFIDHGAVLTYGTEQGGPMNQYDPYNDEPEYIVDYSETGSPNALSKADLAEGEALAKEMGVKFVHLTEPTDLTEIFAEVDPAVVSVEGGRIVEVFQLKVWPFGIGLAALLIWELTATVSRAARRVG